VRKPPVTTLESGQSLHDAPRSDEDDFLVCHVPRLCANFVNITEVEKCVQIFFTVLFCSIQGQHRSGTRLS